MNLEEAKLSLAKSSKRAAIGTLIGVVMVVAALAVSFYYLSDLGRIMAESKNLRAESLRLSRDIKDKKDEVTALEKKRDELKQEVIDTQNAFVGYKDSVKKNSPEADKVAVEQIEKNPQSKLVIQDIKTITPTITKSPVTPIKTKDKETALAKEREGFQNLINGKYDAAIAAFQASENAYNSYNQVYELARFLRRNKAQMNDPAKKKQIFQIIVKDYSYGAPKDLWQEVVKIANQ